MKKNILIFSFLLFAFGKMSAQQTVGLFLNDSLALNGYTLFSNSAITYLIDNCGEVVNTWESDFNTNSGLYLLENGNLLRSCRIQGAFNSGGAAGRVERFNWEGDLLWSYDYASNDYFLHHDIEPLPNGNFLLVAWEARTQNEAIQAGRNPDNVTPAGMWPERIVEIEMVGTDEANVVWQWHAWDHLVQDFDDTKDNYGVVADHPELINVNANTNINADWMHVNAIAYNPVLDQVALSSRSFSEIWVIDHSTTIAETAGHTGGNWGKGGDILYRWGNPRHYDRGDDADQTLYGQHNITWIPEGYPNAGKFLAFNNGQNRFPNGDDYSSVDIWAAPTDADGNYLIADTEPFGPTGPEWTYESPNDFYSSNISGAQALPNGNILICEGRDGRLFEVTLDGEIVWEYINPVSGNQPISQGQFPNNNSTFRALRYPADYPAFDGRDLTPGDPVELNPLPSDCVIFDDTAVSGTRQAALQGVWLRQNPVSEEVAVENLTGSEVIVEVWNVAGRRLASQMSADGKISIDASHWAAGFYVLRIFNVERTAFFAQKFVKN